MSDTRQAIATFTYIMGVTTMIGSDCQKYYTLKYYYDHPEVKELKETVKAAEAAGFTGAVAAKAETADEKKKTVYRFLIDEGYFALTRNPNYLGEMMLYGSFASLCPRYEPWVVL